MKSKKRQYILVGEKQNWEVSLKSNLWGFTERTKGWWKYTKPFELVAFYVTNPTKKVIGFGIVKDKFIDESLLWSDEKFFNKPVWKYRISFDKIYVCENWDDGILLPPNVFLQASRSVISESIFFDLVKKADLKWKTKIMKTIKNMQSELIDEKINVES